jgi:hypothetical protein
VRGSRQPGAGDQLVPARANHHPVARPRSHFQAGPAVQKQFTRKYTLFPCSLEIPRLRSEDTGDYYCIAQNEVGAASDFVSIEILGKSINTINFPSINRYRAHCSVPPTISRETVELNPRLPLGRSLTLFCDVSAKPSPEMRWFLNGTPIDAESSQAANHLLVFGEGHRFLQIQNISLAQRGSYRCEASNAAGKDSIEYRVGGNAQ